MMILSVFLATALGLTSVTLSPLSQPTALLQYRFQDQTTTQGKVALDPVNNQQVTQTSVSASSLQYTLQVGSNAEQALGTVSSFSGTAYDKKSLYDVTAASVLSATLRVKLPGLTNPVCTLSVNGGARVTIVISENLQNESGSCVTTGQLLQSCTVTQPSGLKTFSCTTVTETLPSPSCDSVDVRVRRTDKVGARCEALRIKRTSNVGALLGGEAVYLTKLFRLSDGNTATSLLRDESYTIDETTALTGLSTARSYEITVKDSTIDVTNAVYETGFFKLLNAAHRETTPTQVNNLPAPSTENCDVAIESNGVLIHYEQITSGDQSPSGAAAFYELPVGTYTAKIFAGQNERSYLNVYGTVPAPVDVSSAAITHTITIERNKYIVVVLSTTNAPYTSVSARNVALGATTDAPALGSNYVLHNEISGSSNQVGFIVADASGSRCDKLSTGAISSQGATGVINSQSLVAAGIPSSSRTVHVVDGTVTCKSYKESEAIATINLGSDASSSCTLQHFFVLGRSYTLSENSNAFSCQIVGGNGGSISCPRTSTRFGDTLFTGDTLTSVQNGPKVQVIEVPLCQCEAPEDATCPTPCELGDKIDAVGSIIGSVPQSLTAIGTKTINAVNAVAKDVKKLSDDVDKDYKNLSDDIKNAEDECKNNGDDLDKLKDLVKKIPIN